MHSPDAEECNDAAIEDRLAEDQKEQSGCQILRLLNITIELRDAQQRLLQSGLMVQETHQRNNQRGGGLAGNAVGTHAEALTGALGVTHSCPGGFHNGGELSSGKPPRWFRKGDFCPPRTPFGNGGFSQPFAAAHQYPPNQEWAYTMAGSKRGISVLLGETPSPVPKWDKNPPSGNRGGGSPRGQFPPNRP